MPAFFLGLLFKILLKLLNTHVGIDFQILTLLSPCTLGMTEWEKACPPWVKGSIAGVGGPGLASGSRLGVCCPQALMQVGGR